jgi:hypothetical protein
MITNKELVRLSALTKETMTREDAGDILYQPSFFHIDTLNLACDKIYTTT